MDDDSLGNNAKLRSIWLHGRNESDTPYRVTDHVITVAGRTDERSLQVEIQPK